MLKWLSYVLLYAYITKIILFQAHYPDALIILFLAALCAVEKFLLHRKEFVTEKNFQDDMKKEVQEIKNTLTGFKLSKGNILGR